MQRSIQLGDRVIGSDEPPLVVAEAAVNHQGDISVARHMVHVAHAMGADAIKFQMHVLDDEMLRDTPQSDNFDKPLYETLDETNLSLEEHEELMALCRDLGILYLCTPFSRAATDILDDLGIVAYKVGSGELTNLPLQAHIAGKGRPMIVSTGMASISEVKETVDLVQRAGTPLMITHCVSAYPAPYDRVNLGMIPFYQEQFGVPVGLSDHSRGIYTSLGAVALGACLIEKHFTLDKLQPGPDHASSLEPFELGELTKGAMAVFLARGSEKRIFPEEEQIVAWARESVVSVEPIPEGSVIDSNMVWVKRPSPVPGAVPAKDLSSVVGRKAKVDIPANVQIFWDHLE